MALYDSLFTMMDMQAAQLLVTASDFEHDGALRLSCHGSAVVTLFLSWDTSALLRRVRRHPSHTVQLMCKHGSFTASHICSGP